MALMDPTIKAVIKAGHFINEDGKPVAQALDADNLWLEITDTKTGCWRFRYRNPMAGTSMSAMGQ